MRRKKVFVQHVGQIVARDVHHHHYWPDTAPPDDPERSRQCPQCGRLTWRLTLHCVHCGLDLRTGSAHRGQPWRWLKALVRRIGARAQA